uniref:hypothetical protein n=2 Tax=Cephaloticoccus sp. TaxID=1985742 RepID=UPI00404AF6F5
MHSSSFVLSICRVMLVVAFLAGFDAVAKSKKKPKEIEGDLIVTGDTAIDGGLAVTGDLDVSGGSLTQGSRSDTYGLGTFYMDSGVDGVRWRLNREAGWLWEMEVSGSVSPLMRLGEANRLTLYVNGLAGVVLDPSAPSLSLGDLTLFRGSDGSLRTTAAFYASNISGINTGDQTREDLNLGKSDTVKFGKVKVGGGDAHDRVFVADDLETDGKDFVILADGSK